MKRSIEIKRIINEWNENMKKKVKVYSMQNILLSLPFILSLRLFCLYFHISFVFFFNFLILFLTYHCLSYNTFRLYLIWIGILSIWLEIKQVHIPSHQVSQLSVDYWVFSYCYCSCYYYCCSCSCIVSSFVGHLRSETIVCLFRKLCIVIAVGAKWSKSKEI